MAKSPAEADPFCLKEHSVLAINRVSVWPFYKTNKKPPQVKLTDIPEITNLHPSVSKSHRQELKLEHAGWFLPRAAF